MPNSNAKAKAKEELGEQLYEEVNAIRPALAGKVTGMLLDSMGCDEVKAILHDPDRLRQTIDKALEMLDGDPPVDGKTPHTAAKNSDCKEENGGSSTKTLHKELEKIKNDRAALQAELQEAEQWAEGMQTEWDAKERKWKEAEAELLNCVKVAEEKANAVQDKAAQKPKANAWAKGGVSEAAKAEAVEAKLKEMEVTKVAAEQELTNERERVVELEAALKKASDEKAADTNGAATNGDAKEEAHAAKLAELEAQRDSLEKRVREAEASSEAERKRADEAEKCTKETRAEAEAAAAKKAEHVRENIRANAARCKELEQSCEEARAELEGCRAKLDGKQESATPAPKAVQEEANDKSSPKQRPQQPPKSSPKATKPPKAAAPAPEEAASAPAKKQPAQALAPAKEELEEKKSASPPATGASSEPAQKPARAPKEVKSAPVAVSKAFGALNDDDEEEHEAEEAATNQKGSDAPKPSAKGKVAPTSAGKGSAKKKAGAGTEAKVAKSTKSDGFKLKSEHLAVGALALAAVCQVLFLMKDGLLS